MTTDAWCRLYRADDYSASSSCLHSIHYLEPGDHIFGIPILARQFLRYFRVGLFPRTERWEEARGGETEFEGYGIIAQVVD